MAVVRPNTDGWIVVYVAWCNHADGAIYVIPESQGSPGGGREIVGYGPSIQAARQAGQSLCQAADNQGPDNTGGGNGTDTNVGGAPCPPGTHRQSQPSGSTGGSGGDSTASTDDEIFSCADDVPAGESKDKEKCCAEMASGFQSVSAALKEINATLQTKLSGGQQSIDDIFDEILDKLREKYEGAEKTCDECKQMLRRGLGGTLEYAIQCAGACIDKAACECSMGDPSCWGKPCEGCGQPCCKCEKGICKPTECPPDEKPKKFIGWCSSTTGSIAVTAESAGPPGPGFYQVAIGESEQAVATEAARNCTKSDQTTTTLPPIQPVQPIEGPQGSCDFDRFVGGDGARFFSNRLAANNMAAGIAQSQNAILKVGFDGVNLGSVGDIAQGFVRSFTGATGHYFRELVPTAIAGLGCNSGTFKDALATLSAIQTITNLAGIDLSPWTDQVKYIANLHCRQQFMNPDQALAAFLANQISYEKLDNHWGIANFCPESVRDTVQAARAKPIPLQLAVMRRRKMIDAGGYATGMRQLGYLETGVAEQLFKLTEQVPPMSDIIRFMVRDTDDAALVAKFGLDAKFDDKYQSGLREWAEFQGIPEKIARYNWRAHWGIPAPNQLFTFYQRLRDNPKFGGRDNLLQDVKDALIQQDILPFWHEHFLAVSFHPLGRIDIRRAFNNGTLKDDELVPAYRQLGYSDESSDKLALFSRRLRRDSVAGHRAVKLWLKFAISRTEARDRIIADGLPADIVDPALSDAQFSFASSPPAAAFVRGDLTRQQFVDRLMTVGVEQAAADKIAEQLALKVVHHSALKGVVYGVIDSADARQQMIDFGMSVQVVDNLLTEAESAVDYAFAVACQKGIKHRYLKGEFDQQGAINAVLASGSTNTRAVRLVDNWNCEKSAIGKAVPAARLCNWLGIGVISAADFVTRLTNLGYTAGDASLMRDDCLASVSIKRQKQAEREARDQVAQERRQQAAQRRQNALITRLSNQQARATQKATDTRRRRESQIMSAASKASKKCDCDLGTVVSAVRDGYMSLQSSYGITADESLAILIKAAEAWEGGEIETYGDTVTILALGLVEPAQSDQG